MTRRTYRFTEYFNRDKKLSIQFLTSSKRETMWRAKQCEKENKPYSVYNRITNEIIKDWIPKQT